MPREEANRERAQQPFGGVVSRGSDDDEGADGGGTEAERYGQGNNADVVIRGERWFLRPFVHERHRGEKEQGAGSDAERIQSKAEKIEQGVAEKIQGDANKKDGHGGFAGRSLLARPVIVLGRAEKGGQGDGRGHEREEFNRSAEKKSEIAG